MSRINDLIQELCPDGVKYFQIGVFITPISNINWSQTTEKQYWYIDLSSVDRQTGRIFNTAPIDASNAPSRAQQIVRTNDVLFATTRPAQLRITLIPERYNNQIASTGYCILRVDRSKLLPQFLYYLLHNESFKQYIERHQTRGNYPSVKNKLIYQYRIPLPPMEIQEEIVRILDSFTSLETELETELETRHKQYEYYRDRLLTFKELDHE